MELKTIRFPKVLATSDDGEEPQETATNPQETDIHFIPEPIVEEILYRVPAKTVLYFKTVCKTWLSIVDDPFFAKKPFSRAPICPLLIFTDKPTKRIMHLVEGQTVSDLDPRIGHNLTSRTEFLELGTCPWSTGRFLPVNSNAISCEGIVCWASNTCTTCGGNHIFICNPITGEHFTFRTLSKDQEYTDYVFIGIGFCRACKRFKILRMSRKDSTWWPEVLTVAFKSRWRRVGSGTIRLDFAQEITEVVYVNGAIYWRYIGDSPIFTFHFERFRFHGILIERFAPKKLISLGVLDNSLCVSMFSPGDGHVELWAVEISGDNELRCNKLYNVETDTTRLEHSGVLGSRGRYKAIKYLECGGILMHYWKETFLAYDPVTKTERIFRVLEHSSARSCLPLQVVPHVPSLVKLNDALSLGYP
ncbi:hypothetical protein DH2020_031962 [Rehmannia glutinosa]|uniref:F-box domain-containing protein n=1 Tax=Rehmannia glutinosa TaxID=99300 RepID=A0ABR0VJQ2_REHGL